MPDHSQDWLAQAERDLEQAADSARAARHQQLRELCRRHRVGLLYAFGSRAREALAWMEGDAHGMTGDSDVDLGARPRLGARWDVHQKVALAQDLERLLGCRRVDLCVLPEADPFVAAEVIRGERLYAADEHDADEYELYVLRRAGDLLPLERERQALVLSKP